MAASIVRVYVGNTFKGTGFVCRVEGTSCLVMTAKACVYAARVHRLQHYVGLPGQGAEAQRIRADLLLSNTASSIALLRFNSGVNACAALQFAPATIDTLVQTKDLVVHGFYNIRRNETILQPGVVCGSVM